MGHFGVLDLRLHRPIRRYYLSALSVKMVVRAMIPAGRREEVLAMEVVELTGTVNGQNQIQFDEPLPFEESTRVRVSVVVLNESDDAELERQMSVARRVMAEDKGLLQRLAE
jgi:hypothetical protein